MSKHHCSRCGKKVEGKKYNPYNVTFKDYAFKKYSKWGEEGQYCLKCAEFFVKERNRGKGGHWVIEIEQEEAIKQELRDVALEYKRTIG